MTVERSKPSSVGSSVEAIGPNADSNVRSSSVGCVRRAPLTRSYDRRRTTVKR
ncbi:Uncharacterised protein [Mycobacteroides abscessus]|nr:Uncharacterised protein [Mycobacteroides abscessus]